MRRLKRILIVLIGGYLAIVTMLYFLQEKLIFLPTPLPQNYAYSFSETFQEIFLDTPDGARLNALWFQQDRPKGLILYFHGNAGNLSRWGHIVAPLAEKGFDVLIMDYRTYGKSTGKLSEEALFSDGQLFYDFALKHYKEKEIILYGRSLGTGIACKLAAVNNPVQLLMETPYFSLLDLGENRFPFLPVKWFMKYPLKTYEFIQQVKCPIYIFHGTADKVVPITSGKKLFEVIPGSRKVFETISGGGHNNLAEFDSFQQAVDRALRAQSKRVEER